MKYNLSEMKSLDIYLSHLPSKEYDKIRHHLKPSGIKTIPLLSWDIYSPHLNEKLSAAKKNVELNQIIAFSEKFNWRNDFNKLLRENDYETIIITDLSQKIVWVNNGFSSMTGYSKKFAINKTPRFLQGEKTSIETNIRIKQKIEENKPFKEIILNYKKDKTVYKCEVKIIPLYNNQTTHYIAFEKRVI